MPSVKKAVLRLKVNGAVREAAALPNAILLDVLREDLNLTGSKRGCDMGTCGCCTVHLDGKPVLSCLVLALQAAGREITTIEGLRQGAHLHPLQAMFHEVGGSQCGFCTPGFLMCCSAFLAENPDPSEAEIREAISGNVCRCTGYVKIVQAVQEAAKLVRNCEASLGSPQIHRRSEAPREGGVSVQGGAGI